MGFLRSDRGFTGAERALLLTFGLAIVTLAGALVRRGAEKGADDARRVLIAGWGSPGDFQRPAVPSPPQAQDSPSAAGAPVAGTFARMAGSDAFDQLTNEAPAAAKLPEQVTLPPELVGGLQRAWDASYPEGQPQEHGGLLVRRPDGSLVWRPAPPGEADMMDWNSVYGVGQPGDEVVAMGHTHPYPDPKLEVSFSGADMANLIYTNERMIVMQSGDSVFMMTRTAEFEERLKGLDDEGKMKLFLEMRSTWNYTYYQDPDLPGSSTATRAQNAAEFMARKYNLGYYRGKNGSLNRVPSGPTGAR